LQFPYLTGKGLITFLVAYFFIPSSPLSFEQSRSETAGAQPVAPSITLAQLPFPAEARASLRALDPPHPQKQDSD